MIFLQIIQPDPEAFAVPKMLHYGFREIVRGEVYIADPGATELLNGQLQQRTVAYWQHGLRHTFRQWKQALPIAARHNYSREIHAHIRDQILAQQQLDDAALGIQDWQVTDVMLIHE